MNFEGYCVLNVKVNMIKILTIQLNSLQLSF